MPFVFAICCGLFLGLKPALAAEKFVCAGFHSSETGAGFSAKITGSQPRSLPAQGQLSVLTIFAQFANEAPSGSGPPAYGMDLFDPDRPGSFSHFYRTMSQGQLEIRGTVLPKRYASNQPASAYLSPDPVEVGAYGQFTQEILSQVDEAIDFGQFDSDGPDGVPNSGDDDGFVDYIFINLRSTPRNFILASATGAADLGFTFPFYTADRGADGEPIRISGALGHGAIQEEGSFALTVGSMAHEFGHALGLPDLYDRSFLRDPTQEPAEDSAGIGSWGLMGWGALGWGGGDGPNPFCAWSLERLGWIGRDNDRLVELARDAKGLSIADLHQGGIVCKIPLPPESLEHSKVEEGYLLLEQRVRSSHHYNRHLPGEGLLVWHVRPRARGNEREELKWVDLVCADGLYADAGYPTGTAPDPYGGRDNLDFWAHDAAYAGTHNGNWGDATDPFDGTTRTRFGEDTNPSSVADPELATVTTGVSLGRIQRQGDAMVIDVGLARWAGTIRDEVRWVGEILVDGDLTVAPGGRLMVYPGTRVLFAGTDRLRSGRDPGRCELHLQGDFSVQLDFSARFGGQVPEPVVLEAMVPGETWHGIVVDPASRVLVPADAITIRDAVQGLDLPDAPPGAQGLTLGDWQVIDEAGWETMGNGDGQLGPGESFQLSIELDNWSLSRLDGVRLDLSWSASVLRPASSSMLRRVSTETGSLDPGKRRDFLLPVLTLSPEAVAGQQIDLTIRVRSGTRALREETRSLAVVGTYPRHEASLAALDHQAYGDAPLVLVDEAVTLHADIAGPIAAAVLVVRSLPDLDPVERIPMALLSALGDERRFSSPFQPASPGIYQLALQITDTAGATVYSSAELRMWAVQDPAQHPVLVLLGNSYTSLKRDMLRRSLSQDLSELGQEASILSTRSLEAGMLDALVGGYLKTDGLVMWIGEQMGQETQKSLHGFVQEGGRLFVASRSLFYTSPFPQLLGESFHIRGAGTPLSRTLRSPHASSGVPTEFRAHFAPLDFEAPAEPVLLDEEGNAAGLRVDDGLGRVVYYSFDLGQVSASARPALVGTSAELLRQSSAGAARLAVPGREVIDNVVLLRTDSAVSVRAEVTDAVAAAELIARSFPGLAPVDRIPMVLQAEQGEARTFVSAFQPPQPGQYHLSLELRNLAGAAVFSAASLQAWSPFESWQPTLLLTGLRYTDSDRGALHGLLADAMGDPSEGIDVLESAPNSERLYDLLLAEYLDPGDVVIWHPDTMSEEQQAACRRFLERGGRLLISSFTLHRYSPDSDLFLREILHTGRITETRRDTLYGSDSSLGFFARYGLLEPIAPAEPVLVDAGGNAAGLRLDTGASRIVYLPFDLRRVDASIIQPLVADALSFLRQPAALGADLRLAPLVVAGEVVALREAFEPRVVVHNIGGAPSTSFRVGYQILRDEQVLASALRLEAPLEPLEEREIVLPEWAPISEADLDLRFGWASGSRVPLAYAPSQSLRIADVRGTFDPVALPGDLAQGNGAGFFDYDNDGDLDFYLVRRGAVNQLYRNDPAGFTERAEYAGLADGGWGRGLAMGDYDADGDVDLYLVNEGRNSLWCNNGGGPFTEVTDAMGPEWADGPGLDEDGAGRSAAFFDADSDGDLDLYLVNHGGTNRLFRQDAGRYVESGEAYGLADDGNGRGLAIGDYDGDGDADLFVANTSGSSWLFRNDASAASLAAPRFHHANESVGLEFSGGEVAATFGDYDNDGDLDLFVSNELGTNHLYRNEAGLSYRVQAGKDSLYLGSHTVGAAFCDYDNDGDLDLAATAVDPSSGGDQLFQNRLGLGFVPVGPLLGLSPESSGRAIVFADFDQDGSQDLLVADSESTRLYSNAASRDHWLQLDLTGSSPNRNGLGARVALVNQGQLQYRDVQSGFGYGSQAPTRVHFGLGGATQVDSLQVIWPDGMESSWMGIDVDQFLVLSHPALVTAVAEDAAPHPVAFQLRQNYPNPFNARTVISYQLPQPGTTELSIYNTAGQLVRCLVAAAQPAGSHQAIWDGVDDGGKAVGTGVYLYRLQAGEKRQTRRLLLLR